MVLIKINYVRFSHFHVLFKVKKNVLIARLPVDVLGVKGGTMIWPIQKQFFNEQYMYAKCIKLVLGQIIIFGINLMKIKNDKKTIQ